MKETRTCLVCARPLKGRSDKKFCDDQCRNSFNNQLKSSDNTYVRRINSVLSRNRKILKNILAKAQGETCMATREKMNVMGFQFNYCTHTYVAKNSKTYSYCYEYGYLPLKNDLFLIVKRKDGS